MRDLHIVGLVRKVGVPDLIKMAMNGISATSLSSREQLIRSSIAAGVSV